MSKRESHINGVRMYSDVFENDSNAGKKTVEYYKKVQKTTTQTEIQVGNNPSTKKVVSTTIIQNGDNAPQVSKKFIPQIIMEVLEIEEDLIALKDLEILKIMEYHQNIQKK